MTQSVAEPWHLGDDALRYVREELAVAGCDFDGPLARRLIDLPPGPPFTLLTPEATARIRDFRTGGVDDGRSDECLAAAISRWLGQGPAGTTRMLVLEDPLARRSDAVAGGEALFFGERVYFAGGPGDAPGRIEDVLRCLAGYPGIGVLSELPSEAARSAELTEHALNALASASSALLVRAWDDEAFVVVPVGERLTPHDFQC